MKCLPFLCLALVPAFSARAAEADALAISANIRARHLPFGTVADPVFSAPDSNQIAAYTHCGDSALWTGHWLAAEAFRYRVTRSAEALDSVKQALAGIQMLVDVTGTGVLARCAVPATSPYLASIQGEEAHNGIFNNTAMGLVWFGNTSRDQYSGVIFGLGVAYDMADDPAVRDSSAKLVTRMVQFLQDNLWNVVLPDHRISTSFLAREDQIRSLLAVARHVNPGIFGPDSDGSLLDFEILTPVQLEVLNDDSYFKFNLDFINFYSLVRLSGGSPNLATYTRAYDIVRAHTARHQMAAFDAIDRALKGPDAKRDAELASLLEQWLQRPRRDKAVDLTGTVQTCGSQACQPVPVPLRPPTDYLWQRSPFLLKAGGIGTVETAGLDYILPYWMARFYNTAAAVTVQSAAAPIALVAPDSFASVFGPNMASQTASATSQPWPQSLGGVAVTVIDAAGVSRIAGLTYVSPGQINLVVPASTAPGLATFSIASSAGTQTATATVADTAPALFSANGSGSGVAAATAVRTQAANPPLQSSVPVFQCSSAGCSSVPIAVGVDTPVYLTLYGTGIRGRGSLASVRVTIHGIDVPVQYAGPQGAYGGLDQANVPLILSLRGSGESNVVVTVNGRASNAVTVNIR